MICAVNGMEGGHLDVVKWLVERWSVPTDDQDEEVSELVTCNCYDVCLCQ